MSHIRRHYRNGRPVRSHERRTPPPSAAAKLQSTPPPAPTDGWDADIDRGVYASAPARTPAELDALIRGGNPVAMAAVARRSGLSHDQVARLAYAREPAVRAALASNLTLDEVTVGTLAQDADVEVQVAALSNPLCPSAALVRAAGDADPIVSSTALTHYSTPVAILRAAAAGDALSRMSVAENGGAPADVLDQLSRDDEPAVRESVAANPFTPLATILRLASQDPEPRVRALAWETLALRTEEAA